MFALELFQPFMVCMAPVLIAALVQVLFGRPVLELAMRGTLAALGLASAWTYFQMNRRIVEIRFRQERVAMVSVWKAAQRNPSLAWERALDVRPVDRGFRTTVGHTTYELTRADWPELDKIAEGLRATQP